MDGEVFAAFFVAFFAIGVVLWLYIFLPAEMAERRGRSPVGWVILSLMFSPVFTIIALLVLGPTVELAMKRMREEEDWSENEPF